MYKDIVVINHPLQVLGLEADGCDSERPEEIKREQDCESELDWDDEKAQMSFDEKLHENETNCHSKFLAFFHSFFLVWYLFF